MYNKQKEIMKNSVKATVSVTVGKATKLGLEYNPLKDEFTATVKNIVHDEDWDSYEGVIKYQGKNLRVHATQDTEYWTIVGLAN